jgi:Tol biopolymer transport system component
MTHLKTILYCVLLSGLVRSASGQLPDTDIFLATVSDTGDGWEFGEAENISARPGYDNQPSFSSGSSTLLYVAVMDSVQSDIMEYDPEGKISRLLISTPESEYSPVFTPDGKAISVVRVDFDAGQRFYTLSPEYPFEPTLIPNTDSVGYYCWLNDSLLAMFLVGERFALTVLNVNTTERNLIRYDIGRCLKLSPDRNSLYFLDKSDSLNWKIAAMSIQGGEVKTVCDALGKNEDFALLPDGTILMGNEGKLYIRNTAKHSDWKLSRDYTASIGSFYRISVNESGTRIAFVSFTGRKP